MSAERRRELLQSCAYFARLEPQLLDRIGLMLVQRRFRAGERIFAEGDDEGAAALHIVDSGVVRIFKLSLEGREQVLRLMRPGDTFADVPAFDGGPYPANADALEPATVYILPRRALLALLREHPDIAVGSLQIMAARLRHMTGLVEDLSLRRVMARVARLILENQGNASLSQSQMAAMVGTAREMVNRSLHTLAERGAISLDGPAIVVLDAEALSEIVESG
ncbi:MAG TPA: Crp/Fnr family transcriptional regulator [Thermomicrobiales bacterium]|nr:Crp/Fnr family transcriptional regulator [Thermomicrobiales bacterium]